MRSAKRYRNAPRGFVHIDGEFFRTYRADIERLLHNEASRARENNPLQRSSIGRKSEMERETKVAHVCGAARGRAHSLRSSQEITHTCDRRSAPETRARWSTARRPSRVL